MSSLEPGAAALLPSAAVREPPRAAGLAFDREGDRALSPDRSYSVGTTSRGRLVQGRPLPVDHPSLRRRPISVERSAIWGTGELVAALERAARRVATRWPGSLLFAGDLSARRGGDIPGHASHNSGRDADLAFYLRDRAGRRADGPGFPSIGRDGATADGERRFDEARNWALVEALLRDPHVQVQWIFVASWLEDRLLAHARQVGAEETVVDRATAVLKQPGDSSAHAEHFHVRLYCALEERVEGCLDAGPVHAWVDTHEEALLERVRQVLPFLRSGAREEVRYAVTRIVRLRARVALPHLEPLVDDEDPEIAALADDAVAFLRGERTPPAWAHLAPEDVGE
ncbi:MAG: penicillin-insensitive murein endopeptidase [Myxococcota bacterium]